MRKIVVVCTLALLALAAIRTTPTGSTPLPTCTGCTGPDTRDGSLQCRAEPPQFCFMSFYLANYQYETAWVKHQCGNGYWIECQKQYSPNGCCNDLGSGSPCPAGTCIPDV